MIASERSVEPTQPSRSLTSSRAASWDATNAALGGEAAFGIWVGEPLWLRMVIVVVVVPAANTWPDFG